METPGAGSLPTLLAQRALVGEGLRLSIFPSNKFPGGGDAGGWGPHCEVIAWQPVLVTGEAASLNFRFLSLKIRH